MPPRRKSGKKNGSCSRLLRSSESHDDDVFDATDQPKKIFRRYKARSSLTKNVTNSKSNDTSKHVDKEQTMASSPEKRVNSANSETVDLVDSDIELDIVKRKPGPRKPIVDDNDDDDSVSLPEVKRTKGPRKRCSILKLNDDDDDDDDSVGMPEVKRKKGDASNDDIPNIENASEKSTTTSTIESNQSNELNTDSNAKESDKSPNDLNDKQHSSDGENSDEQSDIELNIENEIEFRVEPETDIVQEIDVENTADAETEHVDRIETETEVDTVAVDTNKDDEETECSPNSNNEQNNDDDGDDSDSDDVETKSQGNADDDVLNLGVEDDLFADDDDFLKSPCFSPIAPTRKPVGMSIPQWKKTEMEKGKKIEPQKVDENNSTLKRTISIRVTNDTTTAVEDPKLNKSTAEQNRVVFKVPRQVPQTLNRDPRFTQNLKNIRRVVQNNVETIESSQVPPAPQVTLTSVLNDSNGPRVPVKDRLGVRHNTINSNSISAPPPRPNSNDQTSTSFVIPKNLSSTFLADRINQPVSRPNVDPRKPPVKDKPIVSEQESTPQNVTPPMPAFALNPVRKNVAQLTLPSFATGPQQYEPVFTYLFKRTCRYFMVDACQNPNECQLEHRLPDHDFFRKSLDNMFQRSVIDLYDNYMRRNGKLFDYYLIDFCNYFGKNKLSDHLKQMVEDCNERNRATHFRSIVEGFILTGQSFTKALAEVISAVHYRSITTSKEIVSLILNQRNGTIRPFINTLNSIGRQENFKFKVEWMNRLLLICNEKNVHELYDTIWHLIDSDQKSVSTLDSDQLTKFMDAFARSKTQPNA